MEDFRLKVYQTVLSTGSFTAAARQLGISQPAVSKNISELERFAGVRLLDRSKSGVSPTPDGERMLEMAADVSRAYERINNRFATPESTLLRSVLLEGKICNVLIEHGRFASLDVPENTPAARIVDASGTALLPSMYNTHTHAAMTLLRGYADDLPLKQWLEDYVWPYEDKLAPADIRYGSELACREMLSGGTTFFNDMYFDIEETIDEVVRSGMRAAIGITVMENHAKA